MGLSLVVDKTALFISINHHHGFVSLQEVAQSTQHVYMLSVPNSVKLIILLHGDSQLLCEIVMPSLSGSSPWSLSPCFIHVHFLHQPVLAVFIAWKLYPGQLQSSAASDWSSFSACLLLFSFFFSVLLLCLILYIGLFCVLGHVLPP